MRTLPKGLRILRVTRETTAESSSILPGVAPARIEGDSALVSRATRKILSPFWPSPCVGSRPAGLQKGAKNSGGSEPPEFWAGCGGPGGP